jgi:hypothetical protein
MTAVLGALICFLGAVGGIQWWKPEERERKALDEGRAIVKAITQYEAKHGGLPNGLDDLTPELLGMPPTRPDGPIAQALHRVW